MVIRPLPRAGTECAIYARYSTTQQSEHSIEDQLALCSTFAERQGWPIALTEGDAARSGSTMVGRDGLQRIIAAAEAGIFQVLIVESQDRLSRDQADTFALLKELNELGITIVSVHDGGPLDPMRATLNSLYAQLDIQKIADRIKRGQAGVVRRGLISGSVAYGYDLLRTTEQPSGLRTINLYESAVVRRIYEYYRDGLTPQQICDILNHEAVPAPGDKKPKLKAKRIGRWRPAILVGSKQYGSGILRNTIYKGVYTWGRTQRRKLKSQTIVSPSRISERITSEIPHLRIVSDELFDAVQDRLDERRAAYGVGRMVEPPTDNDPLPSFRTYRRPTRPFSGLVKCGLCGSPYVMLGPRLGCEGRARLANGCSNSRRTNPTELEQAIFAGVGDGLLRPELIDPFLKEYRAEHEVALRRAREQVAQAAGRISALEAQKAQLVDHLLAMQAGSAAARAVEDRLERLGHELDRAQRAAKAKPIVADLPSADEVATICREAVLSLRDSLTATDPDAIRARDLIRAMITRIEVSPVPVAKQDGRGAGPVQVAVQGDLGRLIQLAPTSAGRVTLTPSLNTTWLDHATLKFVLAFEIARVDDRWVGGVLDDIALIEQAFFDQEARFGNAEIDGVLQTRSHPDRVDLRRRRMVEYLVRAGRLIRKHSGREVSYRWLPSPAQRRTVTITWSVQFDATPYAENAEDKEPISSSDEAGNSTNPEQ